VNDIDPTKALQEVYAVTREAGVTHAAVSSAVNDYIRENVTFSFLVERLRELTLDAADKIATQRHDDHVMDVQHAHDEGIAEGERRERVAVVAWLRRQADVHVYGEGPLHVQADIIERGEHRREEEK